jgi:hypothetical protein
MSLKNCPDCGGNLGTSATKCRCGWTAPGASTRSGERANVPCAAHPGCRFAGMLWVPSLQPNERLCVNHYYAVLESHPEFKRSPTVPPKMGGVSPKPVAGS